MTIFTRNEKSPEPSAAKPATPQPAAVPTPTPAPAQPPAPAATEVKRPQAVAASGVSSPTLGGSMSLISRALKITGQLESTEDIQIDGEIDGDVRGVSVKVGNNAKIKGSVYGEQVELAGTVEGKIEAKKVVLTSTAHMSGDVVHQEIKIDSGAYINGYCRPDFGKTASKPIAAIPKSMAGAGD
jgi:cytoskeletal protein CcmA (bactofilin family)